MTLCNVCTGWYRYILLLPHVYTLKSVSLSCSILSLQYSLTSDTECQLSGADLRPNVLPGSVEYPAVKNDAMFVLIYWLMLSIIIILIDFYLHAVLYIFHDEMCLCWYQSVQLSTVIKSTNQNLFVSTLVVWSVFSSMSVKYKYVGDASPSITGQFFSQISSGSTSVESKFLQVCRRPGLMIWLFSSSIKEVRLPLS